MRHRNVLAVLALVAAALIPGVMHAQGQDPGIARPPRKRDTRTARL